MIRLQPWEIGPYLAAFSLHIPDMRVETVKICPRTPTVSLSNTSDRQAAQHLPLGVIPNGEFGATCTNFEGDSPRQIVFFSHGVPEAEDGRGRPFGIEQLEATWRARAPGIRAAQVMRALWAHLGETSATDEASILATRLP